MVTEPSERVNVESGGEGVNVFFATFTHVSAAAFVCERRAPWGRDERGPGGGGGKT